MDFLDKRIEDYSQIFSDREPSLLKEIHDYTLQNVPNQECFQDTFKEGF